MSQRCSPNTTCCPLGSTLPSAKAEKRDDASRSAHCASPSQHIRNWLTRKPAFTWILWASSASF